MCPEELAGPRRRDVYLDSLVIRVRVAEPERTNGKRAPGATKSDAGARLVVLPAFLDKELKRRRLGGLCGRDLHICLLLAAVVQVGSRRC
ncbi:hypothetical protein GCM10023083_08960 [Streptomyces phyllanthi]